MASVNKPGFPSGWTDRDRRFPIYLSGLTPPSPSPSIRWPEHIQEQITLPSRRERLLNKLRQAGLEWPTTSLLGIALAQAKHDALESVKVSWASGETQAWIDTSMPAAPVTLEELEIHSAAVDFALRRAVDGTRPSRGTAVDALELAAGLREILSVFRSRMDYKNDEERLAAVQVAWLCTDISRCLILYHQTHARPDLARRDDPDAYLSAEATASAQMDEVKLLAASHEFIENAVDSNDASMLHRRALLFAHRVMAHASVDSVGQLDTATATGLNARRLRHGGTLLDKALREAVDRGRSASDTVPLALARSIVAYRTGASVGTLRRALVEAARNLDMQPYERINFWKSVTALPGFSPSEGLEVVDEIMRIALDQPLSRRNQLLAANMGQLVDLVLSASRVVPVQAARSASLIAGFGSDKMGLGSDRHIWLLHSGRGTVAILDLQDCVQLIELPDVGKDESLGDLVYLHAEEHHKVHQLGDLRRRLTDQLRPLTRRVAELEGPATFYGFGHMKHIPLAALTGSGAILAKKPGITVLTMQQEWSDGQRPTTGATQIIIDEDVSPARPVRTGNAEAFRFNSSTDESYPPDSHPVLSQLRCSPQNLVFFGHGYVDQFRSEHVGLVVKQDADKAGAYFVPASWFANGDYRNTNLALIMACGSGQSSVFTTEHPSVAEALCIAGCDIAIAPIWPIEANIAAEFTNKFLEAVNVGVCPFDAWATILSQDPNKFISITAFGRQ